MNNIEQKAIDFLIMSLWVCFKKLIPLFIIIPGITMYLLNDKIKEIPTRYQVKGVVKMGYLKVRTFKSSILEKMSEVTKREPVATAMGHTKQDLKLVLETKFMSDRGKNKKILDDGPFITSISFPEESNLIVVFGEGKDVELAKKKVFEVISYLEDEYIKNKKVFMKTVRYRVKTLTEDHMKMKENLVRIDKVEKEFGFTPFLSKQKNEILIHETRLRYMLLDVQSQMTPSNIQDFELISVGTSSYPVTKRKLYYYIGCGALGVLATILLILGISIYYYQFIPPPVPVSPKLMEAK